MKRGCVYQLHKFIIISIIHMAVRGLAPFWRQKKGLRKAPHETEFFKIVFLPMENDR